MSIHVTCMLNNQTTLTIVPNAINLVVAFQISIAIKKETVRSSWPSHALQKVPVESKLQPFLPELATETIHQTKNKPQRPQINESYSHPENH